MLTLTGVSRRFGEREALQHLDLRLAPGERVALTGSNGSGKSTLLRLACGRDRPTTGSIRFDGLPMDEDDPRVRSRVAVVAEALSCYPDLTVRQHLELVAVAHAVPDPDSVIERCLDEQTLAAHADALPGSLSSGQTQAMLLAAAWVRPRDLLVLDEPEQRLDVTARDRLAARLRAEGERGTAVLFATHHPALAHSVADRVLVLEDGRVVSDGPPERTSAQWQR
ncbi:ABC transporter ATP-binding protein [Streptodolium elevatio]